MQLLLDGTALTAAPRAELTLAFTGTFGAGFAALEEFRAMKSSNLQNFRQKKTKKNKSAMSAERGRPQACAHDSKHPDGDAGENSENRAGQEAGNQPVKQDTSEEAGRRTAEREMDTSVPEKDGAQQQPRWPLSAYEVEQLELSRAMDAELKTASRLKTHTRIFLGPGDAGEKMGRHVFSVCAGPVHAKFDTNTRV
jgi:hypothetical protein